MNKNKEVSTPPNKMKHISPLQRNVFLPLTCRILKKETTYSSQFLPIFVMIDKGYKKLESFTQEKKKMIKGAQEIHKNAWMQWKKMLWMTR